jgi:Nitrite/Sulfite reductase ferredoxin-like half domain/Nitrite and sulphite reductase 4Fe-4S domain
MVLSLRISFGSMLTVSLFNLKAASQVLFHEPNLILRHLEIQGLKKYGPQQGVVDITTRANIQLRGVKIEDAPDIIDGLHARNQTSYQSALDNVRNMVGSPLAGIDDQEMVDTRELCIALNDLVSLDPVTGTRGNPYWGNLPRKFNIAISGSRYVLQTLNIVVENIRVDSLFGFLGPGTTSRTHISMTLVCSLHRTQKPGKWASILC